MRSEDLRFRAGDASLAATLTIPETDERAPWAVLIPSWLPRDRDGGWDRAGHPGWFAPVSDHRDGIFARLAAALAHRGVASLRYDPRGCGESDGAWERTDLFTRIDDARDAIGAMRSRRELDLRRCAIVGHGEGAAIATSVAIGDPAISAVGLIGPSARSLRDVLRRGVGERSRTGTDRRHPFVEAFDRSSEELIERAERRETAMPLRVADETVELALAGWEQAFHTPVLALATMLHRNVVIAHGSDDAWAHPDESLLLAQVLRDGGNQPLIQVLDGVGHDLAEADDAAVDGFAAALAERIERRELPPVLVAIEQMGADG
ncbi:MAG TPA: alpha/beta fold hydrolase [Candidatus Limnocylindria bacterium]|nr:alpha/beta fold hydrolase [Candidatus Limnocylindria bacterium]